MKDSIGRWQTVQFYSAEIRLSSRLPGTLSLRPSHAALAAALALVAVVAADDLFAYVVTWAFVLNVAGSAGDMVMMLKVMSYPRATRFEDTGDGFVAYGPVRRLESP